MDYNPLGNNKAATQLDADNIKVSLLEKMVTILQNFNNVVNPITQSNWTSIIGNSVDYTYDVNNNVTTAEYYEGATLVFTQTFTYDVNNNCTNITTT